jgi:fimbrial isopeptide formation D2 family protein/LPXTG-motif cell wall-anchored protein
MNKAKKFVSVLLALVMALAMTTTAFATPGEGEGGSEDSAPTNSQNDYTNNDANFEYNTSNNQDNSTQTPQGPQASTSADCSITITDAKEGHTYNAFQIFAGDLNTTTNEAGETEKTLSNIVWGSGITEAGKAALDAKYGSAAKAAESLKTAADAEAFAKELVAGNYLGTSTTMDRDTDGNYAADGLHPGYYLIRDQYTAGANPDKNDAISAYIMQVLGNETMKPKAETPDLDKKITGLDADTAKELEAVSAEVGKTVNFELTSKVPEITGYTNKYIFTVHDTMSSGLTFNNDVKVTVGGVEITFVTTTANNGEITIEVDPAQFLAYIKDNSIAAGTEIKVTYSAKINENALQTDVETNAAKLEYSNNPYDNSSKGETPETKVYVYDFTIEIDKYDENTAEKLEGAQFVLQNAAGKYYQWNDAEKKVNWIDDEASATLTTNEDGKLVPPFQGLEAGTYTLKEVKAPDGYNKLKGDYTITIEEKKDAENKVESYTITVTDWDNKTVGTPQEIKVGDHSGSPVATQLTQEVQVPNNSGALLPETGGIGTTIFYIVGGVLAAGAVVLLITKRRMNIDKD